MAAAETKNPDGKKVARREWIDAKGNVVDDAADATGFRYIHLTTAKRLAGSSYDPQDPPPAEAMFERQLTGSELLMCGIFGALTLAGNIASSETNPKSGGDPDTNPIPAIAARFDEMRDGKWTGERGDRGPRYDNLALAKAIAKVKNESDHNPYLARLEAKDKVAIKGKGTILYAAYAMKNTEVQKYYAAITGQDEVTASDL